MKQATQNILLERTHSSSIKAKTQFKVFIERVLVSCLILTITLGNLAMPVLATEDKNVFNTFFTQKTMRDSFIELKDTVTRIESMKTEGLITNPTLSSLSKAIDKLDGPIDVSATEAEYVFERIDNILNGLDKQNVYLVVTSLKKAREKFGIYAEESDGKQRYIITQAGTPKSFPDVGSNDWYYNSVMDLVSAGAINGYPDGTFAPNNTITYAEYIAILVKTTNAGDGNYNVSEGESWYNGVLRAAYTSGILIEGEVTDFEVPITRADATKFTERVVQKVLGESEVNTKNLEALINDYYSSIKGTSAEYYILQQYGRGIIVGDNKGNFNPNSNLTRAEASTIILRTVRLEKRSEVTIPAEGSDPYKITNSKFYNGRMKTEVATEFDLQALSSARFYRENGKLYVSIDLPELPDGFVWNPCVSAYDKDGNYVFCSTEDMDYGKSGHLVIEVVSAFSDKTTDDIASASLGIRVENSKRESMLGHTLSTDMPNKVLRESDTDSTDFEWLDFDTSNIFQW